jgi:hypothetical protein
MKTFLFLLFSICQLHSQTLQWKREIANPVADGTTVNDVDFDSQGNVYIVGSYVIGYQDPQDPNPLPDGAFVQKYSPSGQHIWSDTIRGDFIHHTTTWQLTTLTISGLWALPILVMVRLSSTETR